MNEKYGMTPQILQQLETLYNSTLEDEVDSKAAKEDNKKKK